VLDGLPVVVLVVDQGQFTLLLHTVVDHASQLLLLQLFGLVNFVPNALIDLLTTLLVLSDESLNLLAQLALLSL